jgi:hypothetical protein
MRHLLTVLLHDSEGGCHRFYGEHHHSISVAGIAPKE